MHAFLLTRTGIDVAVASDEDCDGVHPQASFVLVIRLRLVPCPLHDLVDGSVQGDRYGSNSI